ncbi:MAG TPA: DNA mismatch repair protein MutS [Ktedonobacterales bacterium]|nr:DNA mismatch repair protein MutS [Ktedonobacterales bacterium]
MTTPARKQYLDIKAEHQNAILLYQVGDFFETFDEDARIAARELQLVLTSRAYGPGERVPLAGVPLHALESYAARLVAKGYKVAVCEQISPPGRGLVRREVTRVLTPGTLSDPSMVPPARDTYLAAVARGRGGIGLAYVDVTSGAFACTGWPAANAEEALRTELQRLAPAEVLIAEPQRPDEPDVALDGASFTSCPTHYFDAASARERLCRHFGVPSLAAYGCERRPLAVAAAGAILAYVERMNPALARLLAGLRTYDAGDYVEIDGRTWRALEVLEPSAAEPGIPSVRSVGATLLAVLDATRTAMGARLLRRQLLQPLRDREALEARLDAVDELHSRHALREHVAVALDGMGDIERLTARIVHGTALPRELLALAASLARVRELGAALRDAQAPSIAVLREALDPCDDVRELILRAIEDPDTAPGRMLRAGYDAELDTQIAAIADARAWIARLEASERERTGIKSLKVGYNSVFGYYIEVSRPNLARVPPDYQRRQSIAGGERFVTAALKEHEARVLAAEERISARERTLYAGLLASLAAHQLRMRATGAALAQADVWLGLALVAQVRGYVRPMLSDSTELAIEGGRHPIVEAALDGAQFVPNDTRLAALDVDGGDTRLLLLTGPNMAGKSTYLRQVALVVLMAQIGSFVPARRARIGLVDRIFARVGAQDDLARGLSTFMLEMVETAYILRHATPRSLVILDEVGRGTSTRDGLAIARAVLEHLHDESAARALFATHYHELATATEALPRLRICRMAVTQHNGQIVFLHRVADGAAEESYGVQVARMAGLPAPVVERATALLEERSPTLAAVREVRAPYAGTPDTSMGTSNGQHEGDGELALALAGLNLAAMTPIEALNVLFSLQQHALTALRGVRP